MPPKKKKIRHPVNETGVIRKHWGGRIRVALVYPNTYYIGMSNLGFQSVYYQLNEIDYLVCERAFFPDGLKGKDDLIKTVESGRSLHDFDVVAFSVSFETDYLQLVSILKKAGLPLRTNARNKSHPLIIGGGVTCFFNPEPIAPFIDCIFVGESETLLPRFFELYEPDQPRESHLETISKAMDGIYIPGLYDVTYHKDSTISGFTPRFQAPSVVKRVFSENISSFPTATTILTNDTSFSDTYLIEVSRGCPHGCRFCSAGYIYRPPRFRSFDSLAKQLSEGANLSDKIGLVGAAVSDLPDLIELCKIADTKDITLSFSSLRAEALTPELTESLKKGNVKTATIAPDAGSERMRRVINKGITEENILNATTLLVASGIPNLKLYFMIGLPTETLEDVEEIVILTQKVKQVFLDASRIKKRIGEIHVSINPFVPKPVTPFQWEAMDLLPGLKQKIDLIRSGLKKISNVRLTVENPRQAFIQALLSRGDRNVADLLELAEKNKLNWPKTLKETPLNTDFYVHRKRPVDEILPWDFIDQCVKKDYLVKEYERALTGESTRPCTPGSCIKCGVCVK